MSSVLDDLFRNTFSNENKSGSGTSNKTLNNLFHSTFAKQQQQSFLTPSQHNASVSYFKGILNKTQKPLNDAGEPIYVAPTTKTPAIQQGNPNDYISIHDNENKPVTFTPEEHNNSVNYFENMLKNPYVVKPTTTTPINPINTQQMKNSEDYFINQLKNPQSIKPIGMNNNVQIKSPSVEPPDVNTQIDNSSMPEAAKIGLKVLTAPFYAIDWANNKNKFLGRLLDTARSAVTGGAVKPTEQKSTGNAVADFAADLLGNIGGFSQPMAGNVASMGNAMSDVVGNPVKNKVVSALGEKAGTVGGRYATQAVKSAAEMGTLSGLQTAASGGNSKDVSKAVLRGGLQGAIWGVIGQGLTDAKPIFTEKIPHTVLKKMGYDEIVPNSGVWVKYVDRTESNNGLETINVKRPEIASKFVEYSNYVDQNGKKIPKWQIQLNNAMLNAKNKNEIYDAIQQYTRGLNINALPEGNGETYAAQYEPPVNNTEPQTAINTQSNINTPVKENVAQKSSIASTIGNKNVADLLKYGKVKILNKDNNNTTFQDQKGNTQKLTNQAFNTLAVNNNRNSPTGSTVNESNKGSVIAPKENNNALTSQNDATENKDTLNQAHASTQSMNINDIKADPQRFQFKSDTDTTTGAGKLLKNVGKWDDNLAGRITVWQDKEGNNWVVNGHHRLELAKRLGVKNIDTKVLYEKDGITAKDAREIGAKINLAEGRGTATDAAKVFRDGNYTTQDLKDSGLSLSEGVVKKGYNIAQLNDRLFNKVVNTELTEDQGNMIGEAFPKDGGKNDSLQNTLYDYVKTEGDVTKADLEQAINMLKNSDSQEIKQITSQTSLFDNGNAVSFGDNFNAKKNIIKNVTRRLAMGKNLFKNLSNSKKADMASKAGNVLNSESNEKNKQLSEMAIEFINKDAWKKGTAIGDVFNKYASNVLAGGETVKNSAEAYKEIRQLIENGDFMKDSKEPENKQIEGQQSLLGEVKNNEKQRKVETSGSVNQGGKGTEAGEGKEEAEKPGEAAATKEVKANEENRKIEPYSKNKYGEPLENNEKSYFINTKKGKYLIQIGDGGRNGNIKLKEVRITKNGKLIANPTFEKDSSIEKYVNILLDAEEGKNSESDATEKIKELFNNDSGNKINWIEKESKSNNENTTKPTPEQEKEIERIKARLIKSGNNNIPKFTINEKGLVHIEVKNNSGNNTIRLTVFRDGQTRSGLFGGNNVKTLEIARNEAKEVKAESKQGPSEITLDNWLDSVSNDDINYDMAERSYTWNSMEPDRRAKEEQVEYVNAMKNIYDKFKDMAKNDKQKAFLLDELNKYKQKYLSYQNEILAKNSRVASPMVTGPAKFNNNRNEKAMNSYMNSVNAFLTWNKNFQKGLEKRLLGLRDASEIESEKYNNIIKRVDETISTLKGIEDGTERGYNPSLFRNSLKGFLDRIARNGDIESVKKALQYIRDNQSEHLKTPVFAKNNSIWKYLDESNNAVSETKTEEKQQAVSGTYKQYKGASINKNVELDRVQIFFDEKPSEEVRNDLKASGWHYSPKDKDYRRKLTENALYSAKRIVDKYYKPEVKEESSEDKSVNLQTFSLPMNLKQLSLPQNIIDAIAYFQSKGTLPENDEEWVRYAKEHMDEVPKKKGQFIENSVKNSEDVIPEKIRLDAEVNPDLYVPITNQATWDKALKDVDERFNAIKKEITLNPITSEVDVARGFAIAKKLLNDGDTDGANTWLRMLSGKLRKNARALQAVSMLKRFTPEWTLKTAQRKIESEQTEDQKKKLETKSKEINDKLSDVNKEASGELGKQIEMSEDVVGKARENQNKEESKGTDTEEKKKLEPYEILANRIDNSIKDKKEQTAEQKYVSEMVRTLYKVAKEKIQTEDENKKFDPFDVIYQAMTNKDEYRDVWTKAQDLLKEKYKDDPEVNETLSEYFDTFVYKPFIDKEITKVLKDGLKQQGITLNDLAIGGKEQLDKFGSWISSEIVKRGMDKDTAREIEIYFKHTLSDMAEEKRNNVLQNMFKDKSEIHVKTPKEILNELNNLGAFNNTGISKVRVDAKLDNILRKQIKELGIDLGKIVREHYSKTTDLTNTIKATLIDEGLTPDDAQMLQSYIESSMDSLTHDKKQQILENMFKDRKSPERKAWIKKVIEISNLGGFTDEKYNQLVAQAYNIPFLSNESAERLVKWSNLLQTLDPKSREYEEAIARLTEEINDNVPKSVLQKIEGARILSMLSGTNTPIRNVVGNWLYRQLTDVKNVNRTLLDVMFTGMSKDKKRTSVMPDKKAEREGKKFGRQERNLDFKHDVRTRDTQDKFNIGRGSTFSKNGNAVERGLHQAERLLSWALDDRPYEYAAMYGEKSRIKKLSKINGEEFNEDDANDRAEEQALRDTFNDNNALSELALKAQKFLNVAGNRLITGKWRGKLDEPTLKKFQSYGVGSFILPFAKVPTNIALAAYEYSPLNLLSTFGKVIYDSVNGSDFDRASFTDNLAKVLTGAEIIGLGALLYSIHAITTDRDKDKDKNAFDEQTGQGQFRINLSATARVARTINLSDSKVTWNKDEGYAKPGDITTTYDFANPISTLMALGAIIEDSFKNGGKSGGLLAKASTVVNAFNSGINTLSDQPLTQGMQKLVSNEQGLAEGLEQVLISIPASFIPQFSNQFRKLFDNRARDTGSSNMFNKALKQTGNKVPGVENILKGKVDTLGRDAKNYPNSNEYGRLLNIFVNPSNTTVYNPTVSEQIVQKIYDETGDKNQYPRIMDRKLDFGKKKPVGKPELSDEEYAYYQQYVGQKTDDYIQRFRGLLNGQHSEKAYDSAATSIQNAITKYAKEARENIISKRKRAGK